MNKIQEIFTAWNISFNPNDEQAELASKRIEICNSCEHKKQNVLFKNVCELCGCSLSKKVFTPIVGGCPDGRWNDIDKAIIKNKQMRNLRFVCAQPAVPYYTWQVEVLINNFIKHGVNPNKIDILCAINNNIVPEDWKKLQNHYNTVRFFFYNDTRSDFKYIPAIYFNLMSNHLKAYPELKDEALFLHDSDIVFTRKPELDWACKTNVWSVSDTKSYINYDYIQQKDNDIYEKMCEIIGIDKRIPKLMNSNSGGAQYIVSGEGWEFWDKVEKDAIAMYDYFCEVEPLYVKKYEGDYPIQKWTAGMWSLLWNAWLAGHETIVDSRLSFGWVTNPISDVEKHFILHNAGVTADSNSPHCYEKGLFYKGNFINELPYNKPLKISDEFASSYYWKEICETAKKTILS
jgi:hypothetical protein